MKIDWKSKIVDLLIVTAGITIAFKLNTWNESIKTASKAKDYIESFHEENIVNETTLVAALEYSNTQKIGIDTLKQLLKSKNYSDKRIKELSISMLSSAKYYPSITTMENITASGDFELIKNIKLRKQIINTYNSYTRTSQVQDLFSDYNDKYVLPFFFENIRFSNWSPLHSDFVKEPAFENLVFSFEVLLNQQIESYQHSLEKTKHLNDNLNISNTLNIKQK